MAVGYVQPDRSVFAPFRANRRHLIAECRQRRTVTGRNDDRGALAGQAQGERAADSGAGPHQPESLAGQPAHFFATAPVEVLRNETTSSPTFSPNFDMRALLINVPSCRR